MITIRGLHNYVPQDLAEAVAFLQEHHQAFPFGDLVSASFELADADAAFRYAIEHRSPRVAIRSYALHPD